MQSRTMPLVATCAAYAVTDLIVTTTSKGYLMLIDRSYTAHISVSLNHTPLVFCFFSSNPGMGLSGEIRFTVFRGTMQYLKLDHRLGERQDCSLGLDWVFNNHFMSELNEKSVGVP